MKNFERNKDIKHSLDLGQFIYDNGFGVRWYVCHNCKGVKLKRKISGGFSPPTYFCKDCKSINYSPVWVCLNQETGEPFENNRVTFRHPRTNKLIIPDK